MSGTVSPVRENAAAARRALSDPRRVRIWELLSTEPSTARRLGDALGIVPNRLYYHLRILRAAGLIDVVGAQAAGRMTEQVYAVNHSDVGPELGSGLPEERILFFSSLLETTRSEIADLVVMQAGARERGARAPALSLRRSVVQTSPAGFAELVRRVSELVDEVERAHPGPPQTRLLFALYDAPRSAPAPRGA